MDQSLYETQEYNGYNTNIYYDGDPQHPRKEFDNIGTLYTRHRSMQPEEDFGKHFEIEEVFAKQDYDFTNHFKKKYIAHRVYMYDHSGQTVSTSPFSCRWDSALLGIIAVSIADVKKEYGWKNITKRRREKIEEYLQGEVETFDDYLTGSVYGFTITDDQDNEIDSCWGYYGNDSIEEIKKECMAIIDNIKVAA
ncbi:hypothetical protein [Dysgonomonas sp. GY617]|uniref:hypothetical protein n=1 Tax=Dysgonomonas sp. GY617 TaxID=2780420 RepID=UPI0018838921|nr:hypothetical protein [Dysgonomonas sp. GY617]MBF0578189.1 hypothetical protein [Dysgonomonas sp. GY617]